VNFLAAKMGLDDELARTADPAQRAILRERRDAAKRQHTEAFQALMAAAEAGDREAFHRGRRELHMKPPGSPRTHRGEGLQATSEAIEAGDARVALAVLEGR
jgi:hypothetical protein